MWIVISNYGTYDCNAMKFDTREEAIKWINGFADPQKHILAKITPPKWEVVDGELIAK